MNVETIIDDINLLIKQHKCDDINDYIQVKNWYILSAVEIIAILRSTYPVRSKIKDWQFTTNTVYSIMKKRKLNADVLLKGLI